jgi:hypothetical protein
MQVKSTLGVFGKVENMENCKSKLIDNGFKAEEIKIINPETKDYRDLFYTTEVTTSLNTLTSTLIGAFIGGTLGLITTLGANPPFTGLLSMTSPAIICLAGIGLGGSLGAFFDTIWGAIFPKEKTKMFNKMNKDKGTLLSILTPSSELFYKAKKALEKGGATNITCAVKYSSENFIRTELESNYIS